MLYDELDVWSGWLHGCGKRGVLAVSVGRSSGAVAPEAQGLVRALAVLRERWWVVVVAVVVCVGVALALTLSATKEYTATAKLLFGQNPLITEVGGNAPSPSTDPQADQATNLLVVTTTQVAAAVKQALRSPLSTSELLGLVSTKNDQSSNIVDVSATDSSPASAAAIANAFADQYVVVSKGANVQQVLAAQELIAQQLAALPPTPANAGTRANLQAALQRLQTTAAVQTGNAEVVEHASVPGSPSSPNKKVNLIVALVFGLGLGVGLAFLLNVLDRRLKEVEDFEGIYRAPALATIPRWRRGGEGGLDPVALEQFLILRSGLSVLTPGREARVVLVGSAVAGEGKTTVAIGLARAAAASGQSVILVETDFKRPVFRARLGLSDGSRGLSDALVEDVDPVTLLRSPVRESANLRVMTSGSPPAGSAGLLGSSRMGALLERLAVEADLVVLDAPPLLPSADAQALLDHPQFDAYLIVARENFTKREEARYAHQRLEQHQLSGIGLIVNAAHIPAGAEYYHERTSHRLPTRRRPSDLHHLPDQPATDQTADVPSDRVAEGPVWLRERQRAGTSLRSGVEEFGPTQDS